MDVSYLPRVPSSPRSSGPKPESCRRGLQFKRGDEVFGECIKGYQRVNGGAYAEYTVVRPDWIALKPSNVTFEQAASVPTSGIIALSGLRNQGNLRGQTVDGVPTEGRGSVRIVPQ